MSASFSSPATFTCPVTCKEVDGLRAVGEAAEDEEETVGVLVAVVAVVPPHALQNRLARTSTQRRNQTRAGFFVNMSFSFSLTTDGWSTGSMCLSTYL